MTPTRTPAPMPDNFDELTRTWNDPAAFAREKARHYEQIRDAQRPEPLVDLTEPRRSPEEAGK